jgi:hypothetical protein
MDTISTVQIHRTGVIRPTAIRMGGNYPKRLTKGNEMRFVPMNEWGRDHFSLLAYVETCCVDGDKGQGMLDHDRMRTNIPRHPGVAGPRVAMLPKNEGPYKYPTRLRDGKVEDEHDDWDCLYDLEEAKLIEDKGTGIHPVLVMTAAGTQLAEMIRRHKSSGGSFSNFAIT